MCVSVCLFMYCMSMWSCGNCEGDLCVCTLIVGVKVMCVCVLWLVGVKVTPGFCLV